MFESMCNSGGVVSVLCVCTVCVCADEVFSLCLCLQRIPRRICGTALPRLQLRPPRSRSSRPRLAAGAPWT